MQQADAYSEHCIRLRDVADADDPRCPDEMNGCLVVSYNVTNDLNKTFTESRVVSARLPCECLVLFNGGRVAVSDLSDEMRQWLQSESGYYSNEIDFVGTENGPGVSA